MKLDDIKFSWGSWRLVKPNEIGSDSSYHPVRNMTNRLGRLGEAKSIDVYVCSDARNSAIRQLLRIIPEVNIHPTAGNVVYAPNQKPSVVIAHGNSDYCGCGAVGYSRAHANDTVGDFSGIHDLVRGDAIENARAQMERVASDFRGPIIFFNQETGKVELITPGTGRFGKRADFLFEDELVPGLDGRYTQRELVEMKDSQNPEVIFINNYKELFAGVRDFRVSLQNNRYHPIIGDSINYAMSHALNGGTNGNESFHNTRYAIIALDVDQHAPDGMREFFEGSQAVKDYVRKKGGEIYLAFVGKSLSQRRIFKLE